MSQQHVFAAWAFAAGAGIPAMAALNGALAQEAGGARTAAVILFAVGLACAAAVWIVGDAGASTARLAHAPPHLYLGGVFVAFYILTVSVLAPRFGVANTILFAVTAQLVTSTIIDHFGLLGAGVRPIDLTRAGGLALVIAGLFLTQASAAGR